MNIYSTKFKGLKIIKIKKFSYLRGKVIKIFNKKKKYSKFNCFESYTSFSRKGAIRGLHGQKGLYSQEKLIYCLKGKAIDLAVDMRTNSKTYGQIFKKTINSNLPSIALDGGLSKYLTQIKKFPMLSAEEEYMLAKSWRDRGDLKSAQKLVTSHLRLVAKIAMGYRGYGLPVSEMVSEGNIGLMQAVKKFEPEKGFRLATYAMWWIKASIQEYILRSWSLVKMGTTSAQKKLFFNLKKIKNQLSINNKGDLKTEHVEEISKRLNVKKEEVVSMNRRLLGKEKSLNAPVKDGDGTEWQDWLVDEKIDQELKLSQQQEFNQRKNLMHDSMNILNLREREILTARRLSEEVVTLEDLSKKYKISRERIRQIETKAFEKLQKAILNSAKSKNLLATN